MVNFQNIADFMTVCNGICGILSIYYILNKKYIFAFIATIFSFLFDLLDGPLARKEQKKYKKYQQNNLHNNGPIYDSLADSISFGLNPTIIIYNNITNKHNKIISAIYLFSSLYRLYNFTINAYKNKKIKNFVGIPTPLSTFIIYILFYFIKNNFILEIIVLLLAYLMNSNIKIYKPKF